MSFDFFTGEWLVANRRLTSPLTGSTTWTEFDGRTRAWQLFGGAANLDEITMPDQAGPACRCDCSTRPPATGGSTGSTAAMAS